MTTVFSYEFWDAFTLAEYAQIELLTEIAPTSTNANILKAAGVRRFMKGVNSRGSVNQNEGLKALNFFEQQGIITAQRKQEIIDVLTN